MDLIISQYVSSCQGLDNLVESWQFEHRQAMLVADVEDLIDASIGEFQRAKFLLERIVDRHFEGQIQDIQGTRRRIELGFAKLKRCFAMLHQLAAQLKAEGFEVRNLARLRETIAEVELLERQAIGYFPPVNRENVEKSRADFDAGRYEDSAELANAQGCRS